MGCCWLQIDDVKNQEKSWLSKPHSRKQVSIYRIIPLLQLSTAVVLLVVWLYLSWLKHDYFCTVLPLRESTTNVMPAMFLRLCVLCQGHH